MPEMTFEDNCLWQLAILDRENPIDNPVRHSWPFRRQSLRDTIRNYKCNFDNFYHWPVMRDAFISGATPENVATWNRLDEQHRAVAADPPIGGLTTSSIRTLPNGGTGTFARQSLACQILERHFLEKTSDWNRLEPHSWGDLFEFGGGFGALAYILRRLGFVGKHTIFDFPECLIIQEWYLNTLDVENIEFIATPPLKTHPHIFISISALDEASPNDRLKVLGSVKADYYFIWYRGAYNVDQVGYIDNRAWFEDYFINEECEITSYLSPHPDQRILIAER